MRIFLSYARVDWQFVDNLAARLRRYHDVWFDERLHAGQDWWQAILERLDWCECFVYALSPESLASKYCRDEYVEARNLDKHIVPIRLQPNIELPDTLQRIQYADFATRKFEDALANLIGDLGRLELQTKVQETSAPAKRQKPTPAPPVQESLNEVVTFRDAVEARKTEDHETALRLLNTLAREAPAFLPEQVAGLIQNSQGELSRQARKKEYDRLYQQVSLLTLDPYTLDDARELWAELQVEYSDIEHDPENLAKQLIETDVIDKEEALPDWLKEDDTPAPAAEPEEALDWLEALAEASAEPAKDDELPDWLKGEDEAEPAETTGSLLLFLGLEIFTVFHSLSRVVS